MLYEQEPTEKTGYLDQQFRLFHIRDQEDRIFPFHYHDFHKVVILLSGKVTYHIEGKAYHLKPWDILLVNQHAIHRPEILPSLPYERFVLWIRDDLDKKLLVRCFQKASDRSFNLIRLNSRMQEKLKELLFELEASMNSTQPEPKDLPNRKPSENASFGSEILSDALFSQFMVYLNRIFLEKQYIFDRKSYTCDQQIQELLQYINHHLSADLSVDALAEKYYLSKYHMMRKFKSETGYTLHSYINSKRLLLARDLINEGTPVMKAAAQSGFSDYTTFSRAYKKMFNKCPSA